MLQTKSYLTIIIYDCKTSEKNSSVCCGEAKKKSLKHWHQGDDADKGQDERYPEQPDVGEGKSGNYRNIEKRGNGRREDQLPMLSIYLFLCHRRRGKVG